MKARNLLLLLLQRAIAPAIFAATTFLAHATPTFWTGPTNAFSHAAGSSTMDKLTTNHVGADAVNNVWLTRGSRAPLYNAAAETSSGSLSPSNTKWVVASGPLTGAASLTYGTFDSVVGEAGGPSPELSVGKTFYVHIVSDDIYLSLKLTEWGMRDGGSFQYQRSSPAVALPTPTVSITNPAPGAVFVTPTNVNIGASASVSSGSVTNVQFFTNGVSLKSVTASPFTVTATNLNAGSYALTAVATAAGISATSAVVNITVLAPPTVSITNPAPGAVFAAPATVSIGASASVSGGTVTNVQFFTNGVSLKSITAAPFTVTANNLAAGAYALTAVATASGISATSTVVNISVVGSSPTVSITNPAPGAVFAAPASLKLGATAAVGGGTVTNVQFFANANPLGSVTAAPFNLISSPLAAGAYSLSAIATAGGISATSAIVNVSVINPATVNLSGITVAGGHFNFNYTADVGLTYLVQSSSNLVNWVSLATNTASASPSPFSDTFNPNGATYYRVGRLPNP